MSDAELAGAFRNLIEIMKSHNGTIEFESRDGAVELSVNTDRVRLRKLIILESIQDAVIDIVENEFVDMVDEISLGPSEIRNATWFRG